MKLGEEKDGKRTDLENNRLEKIMSDYVRKHDFIHWRGIEFSLWKSGKRKEEIFPPSRGEAFLCKGVLILKKIRVLRETATFCAPGNPYVHRGRIPVKKKGTQWLMLEKQDIRDIKRTILLKHAITVKNGTGKYELILGRGFSAHSLAEHIKSLILT